MMPSWPWVVNGIERHVGDHAELRGTPSSPRAPPAARCRRGSRIAAVQGLLLRRRDREQRDGRDPQAHQRGALARAARRSTAARRPASRRSAGAGPALDDEHRIDQGVGRQLRSRASAGGRTRRAACGACGCGKLPVTGFIGFLGVRVRNQASVKAQLPSGAPSAAERGDPAPATRRPATRRDWCRRSGSAAAPASSGRR